MSQIDPIELELMALRIQTWMLREFNELASVMAIETALTEVTEPDLEEEIRAYRDPRYTVTPAGKAALRGEG